MKTIAIISIAALLAVLCGNCTCGNKTSDAGSAAARTVSCQPSGCDSCPSGCVEKAVKASASPEVQAEGKDNYVEILYFHGKRRCATCMAIESNTKEAVETNFPDRIKDGSVVFRVIDISQKENEAIADKYEVSWSSLYIVRHNAGTETAENMTEFAFANARNSPEVFKAGIVKAIKDRLD